MVQEVAEVVGAAGEERVEEGPGWAPGSVPGLKDSVRAGVGNGARVVEDGRGTWPVWGFAHRTIPSPDEDLTTGLSYYVRRAGEGVWSHCWEGTLVSKISEDCDESRMSLG